MLANDLAKWPSLTVISREALGPVLREQWLQHRGFSSTIPTVNLGHLQGVRYLVRGGFHQQNENLRIDLQVIDVETGVIVRSLNAQGRQSDLPRIEHDLVVKLLYLFNAKVDLATTALPEQFGEGIRQYHVPGQMEEKDGVPIRSIDSIDEHFVDHSNLQLSLERMTQHRMDAYQAAETFWQKAWSAEIGNPRHRLLQLSEDSRESLPLLVLPISLFIHKRNVTDLLNKVKERGVPLFVNLEADGFSKGNTDDIGASQLFFGHIREPRRLFVRAFNERGELIAVYSKWSWHTASLLHDSNPGRISFPMWPRPLISGVSEFPMAWIDRGTQQMTFDLVVVPIPDERRAIELEPVVLSNREDPTSLIENPEDVDNLSALKTVIRMNWNPPITEALPVEGHLPANKQTVSALLNLQAGKIMDVQYLNVSPGTLFFRSLEELKTSLLGYCIDCQDVEKISPTTNLQTIRLQLTLVKDLHALRLGSPSH
jgi:hypothetical protein